VKLKLVEPFSGMLAAPKALMITGGDTTVIVAFDVLPSWPSVEVTRTLLFFTPAVVPCTLTETVQELLAAIEPPAMLIMFVPAVAVMVPAPQAPVNPFGVETTNPAGRLSLNPRPENPIPLLFWIVNCKLVDPFNGIDAAPNALLITGDKTTVIEAFPVLPVPPSVEVICTLLFFTPTVVPWTVTETEHDENGIMVPPDRLMDEAPGAAVTVPPQPLKTPGVGPTTRPAGKLSVKATPLSAMLVFGLTGLKFRSVVAFSGIVAAMKSLVIVGGEATVRLAVAVLPVPPLVEVTLPVVLVYWPDAAPVTVIENWHWLFAAIVAPDRLMPVGAVVVSVPPQTVEEELATVKPVGSVSVKATPVNGSRLAAGLVRVNVNEVVAFSAMAEGLNALAIEGGASTFTEAEAVPPVPPSVEVMAPVVLFCCPADVPVTFTVNVQELLVAIVPPDKLIVFVPAAAVMVPAPQEPVNPFGVEMTSPAGSVSLKATPVSDTLVFGLLMVNVSEVVPFSGIAAAPNALVIVGGLATVRLAEAVFPVPPLVELTLPVVFVYWPEAAPVTVTEN
jgi:hypothetical protein